MSDTQNNIIQQEDIKMHNKRGKGNTADLTPDKVP